MVGYLKNKMKERIYQLIAIQVLILLAAFAYNILAPRQSVVLVGEDLTTSELVYAHLEPDGLVYDIPYFSLYTLDELSLKSGAYSVGVVYEISPMEQEAQAESEEEPLYEEDCIYFSSKNDQASLEVDTIVLDESQTYMKASLRIINDVAIDDFTINIYYSGDVTVRIESISLVESLSYRMMRCTIWVLLFACFFALIDLFYLGVLKDGIDVADKKRRMLFVAIVVFACYPLISNFNFAGHDYTAHLARIVSVAQELSYGQFPVRMMTGMLNGYGYAFSIYYCDIFLYLPAFLYNCTLPLYQCYQIYVFCVTLVTALIAYYSFGKIIRSKTIALVGTALYLVSSYRMCCVYLRAAVGEYTAMTFFPLVAAGMYGIYTEEKPRFQEWILLSLGMAGIIQSHVISTEMVALFLVLVCVVLLKKTLQKQRLIALIKATVTTVGLTAWFVVPFLLSIDDSISMFAQMGTATIQNHGIYFMQLFSVFTTTSGLSGVSGAVGEMPLSLGLSLTVGLGLAIYCWIHREVWLTTKSHTSNTLYFKMAICFWLGLFACLLTTSIFPWDRLSDLFCDRIASILVVVMFPWRYLSIAVIFVVLTTLFALALIRAHTKGLYPIAIAVLLTCVVLVNGLYYKDALNSNTTDSILVSTDTIQMRIGYGEYLLEGTDYSLLVEGEPITQTQAVEVLDYQAVQGDKYLTVSNTADEVQWVVFPAQNYVNYHVYDTATMQEYEIWSGGNNNVTVGLPAGYSGTLVLVYESPVLWHVAEAVSLVTLLLVLLWGWRVYLPTMRATICAKVDEP